jgi:hypothetical protein
MYPAEEAILDIVNACSRTSGDSLSNRITLKSSDGLAILRGGLVVSFVEKYQIDVVLQCLIGRFIFV